jgi:galactokinase
VADLGAAKNTALILSSLSSAYPIPQSPVHHNVHKFLGELSWNFVEQAKRFIAEGDAEGLGKTFDAAQADFDRHLSPACPEELTAPRLHDILNHPSIRPHVLGGKGVGSQGDGSVQFVCDGPEKQQLAAAALSELGCSPFCFTVGGGLRQTPM